MFFTYVARELGNRRKQTTVIALGLALAVALVMVVSSIAAGVRDAQAQTLEAVYGVGTDITVTQAASAPEEGGMPGGGRFEFGADAGVAGEDGSRSVSQTQLSTDRATTAFEESAASTATDVAGVEAAAGGLTLINTSFSGELPDFSQLQQGREGGFGPGAEGGIPGGADGAGGSAFDLTQFTAVGVDTAALGIGPLTAVELVDGRGLETADAGSLVAVLDADYATSSELAVGDMLAIGDAEAEIIGITASTSTSGTSAGDAYLPLDTLQELSGLGSVITTIYVQAESSDEIAAVQSALEAELPELTVNTQSELAGTVSGSLSAASSLIANLGTWLSAIVLFAALLIAILFTVSGVARRTREFGTLKAIGWSNRRIVGQVAGESFATGAIGAAAGVLIGLAAIWIINLVSPTISIGGTTSGQLTAGGGGPGVQGGFPGGGMPGGGFDGIAATASSSEIVLQAPLSWDVVGLAIGLAILGGILAGVIGGWRAARLRPAEALRSIA